MSGFPTIEEVEAADREQPARWYRFLPSGDTEAESAIVNRRETQIRHSYTRLSNLLQNLPNVPE